MKLFAIRYGRKSVLTVSVQKKIVLRELVMDPTLVVDQMDQFLRPTEPSKIGRKNFAATTRSSGLH